MVEVVHSKHGSRVPVIVRIAGLPASTVEAFGSSACAEKLQALRQLQAELGGARSALADRLHAAVPAVSASLRRVLLMARRDCFNGRPFGPYREMPEWPALRERTGPWADRVVELEESLTAAHSGLATIQEQQRQRERSHLLEVLEDRGLLRGIALASPVVVESLHRLRDVPPSRYGRKEARLESALLRYVTRAAFKLSPYSTLTRIGLGTLRDDLPPRTASLRGEGWETRSLLRLKRYVLDQLWDLLQGYPLLRDSLRVTLNDTIQTAGAGHFRFLRPGAWELNPAGDELRFQRAALVKVALNGPVVRWLLSELRSRRPDHGELCRLLAESGLAASAQRAGEIVGRLLQIGFLCLLPPWPADASHLEAEILRHLDALPPDPGLAPVAEALRRLTGLQAGFPASPSPVRSVREVERLVKDLWAGVAPGVRGHGCRRLTSGSLYEDVFLHGTLPGQEVFQMPARAARRIRRALAPVVRFQALYNHRHDFLLTLAAFMAERWPDRGEVGVLELLGEVQPLWLDYIKFSRAQRGDRDPAGTFDPLGLPALASLRRLREAIWQQAGQCFEPSPGGLRLRGEALAAVAARIPEHFAAGIGGCFFLQPADRACRRWVMNRLYEGTGRYGSRFTAVMDAQARRAYTDHLTARSWDERGDELLDITWPQGDTLNVHVTQTRRRLELPGQWLDLPPSRRVSLGSLSIRPRHTGLPPELVDDRGCRCRPVHLGGAGSEYIPTPLKILSLFGPGEMRFILPPREERAGEDVAVRQRLTLDNLVLRRKSWRVALPPLLRKLAEAANAANAADTANTGEAEAFAVINLWRLERGIPDRVFVLEHIYHEGRDDLYKPQYLDFTSPLLASVFRSSLRHNREFLTFEEMLPAPDQTLRDAGGRSWAVEILFDELATQSPAPSLDNAHHLAASTAASHSQAEPTWLTDMEEAHAQEPQGRAVGIR